ncbi:Reticulocalbin-3 [Labeo rohita]|uniref:Reticulocalbin-3 n=1 Tax=Labeo rohita TaxID=84645 RepID=A0ABQ8L3G7_LABRO|nr:Reticulocalbin-3 [Labeo rohita]
MPMIMGRPRRRLAWKRRRHHGKSGEEELGVDDQDQLTADELFQLAESIGPVSGKDVSTFQVEDEESSFEYILAFMNDETLVESEDSGMAVLMQLNDTVNHIIQSHVVSSKQNAEKGASRVVNENAEIDTFDTIHTVRPSTTSLNTGSKATQDTDTELQRMLASYAELSNKVLQYIHSPTLPHPVTFTPTLPPQYPDHTYTNSRPEQEPPKTQDREVPLRDLSLLPREFKVQGGQIGDQSLDISYNNICRQIDNGIKERFSEAEILRGVVKVIKSGNFKDMLMHKDDLTIDELKGFLQSHLGGRSNTELFQELMCTKQNDSETPQQFLYRILGLKQKILFASKYADSEVKYNPTTVQDMFLHTIYQGLTHKHDDIRRELKPLLSDSNKAVNVHGAGVEVAAVQDDSSAKKANLDRKPKADPLQQLTEKVEKLMSKVEQLQRAQQPVPCHTCPGQGGGLLEEARAAGKLEPVPAAGQTVTGLHHLSQVGSHTKKTKPGVMTHTPKDFSEQALPQSTLSLPTQESKHLANFIGAKALVRCNLNSLITMALLDTGAQVSMIDRGWKGRYLPDTPVRPLSEMFDDKEELEVHAVNGDVLPFDGWVIITVSFEKGSLSEPIIVPFLVCSIPLDQPLLGFNVLEAVVQSRPAELIPTLSNLLSESMSMHPEKASLLVSFIQAGKASVQQERLRSELGIGEGPMKIQGAKKPYVTVPVKNSTKHPITIPRKTALGSVQTVAKVIEAGSPESSETRVVVNAVPSTDTAPCPALWHPPVDLSHLSDDQRGRVK